MANQFCIGLCSLFIPYILFTKNLNAVFILITRPIKKIKFISVYESLYI